MTNPGAERFLVRAAQVADAEVQFSHPWNARSQIRGTPLSQLVGLTRTGVSLARIAGGKESFVYHSHQREEEWIYILEGRAIAEIGDEEFEVGAGDFLAFPTPSVAHHLKNPFSDDVVYLMGGENRDTEVADFPRLGKRMVRVGSTITVYDTADGKPLGPLGP